MKKIITYKDKSYDIIWDKDYESSPFSYIAIFQKVEKKFLFFKWTGYENLFQMYEYEIEQCLEKEGITPLNEFYYVRQAEKLFEKYIIECNAKQKATTLEQKQLEHLNNWSGIVLTK